MRFVFINLHCNSFIIKTSRNYLTKTSFSPKHRFLLDYLLENDYEVACYVNEKGSFATTELWIPARVIPKRLKLFEYKKIMKKSGISADKIQLLTSFKEINEDDIVIFYNVYGSNQYQDIDLMAGFKVASMVHFFGLKTEAERLKKSGIKTIFAEADITKYSKIFKKNFSWFDGEFLLSPFVYQDRFVCKVPFENRKNKAVAMGTLTTNDFKDFIDVYGSGVYQPLRKQILDNQEKLSDIIDNYITEYNETKKEKKIQKSDLKFIKEYKLLYNMFHVGQQKKYFSFDMVEKYNEYKICVIPEDVQGMPGVGFIEGMACGCAYIGLDYDGYKDYGMIPGFHFISYDGTIEDLRKKISYFLKPENHDELKEISENGMRFVREHFSPQSSAKLIVNQLISAKKKNEGLRYESKKETD